MTNSVQLSASHSSILVVTLVCAAVLACDASEQPVKTTSPGTFASDVAFLRAHTPVILLSDSSGAQVAVAPAYQGRVMTSTVGGPDAPGFGWIGRAAVASGQRQPHMNVFGGEDRFWLGPEGGQYSLYFKPGDPFDLAHWQVPDAFDWGPWEVASESADAVRFRKRMHLGNYSRATFDIDVDRTIRMLTTDDVSAFLGEPSPGPVRTVGFESVNVVTNAGSDRWQRESGLVSIWILGMFEPSARTVIVIPFARGPEAMLGPAVNDSYFGKVPPDRLAVRDGVILFRGDGRYRSKIGLSPSRALDLAGSYDPSAQLLTLVQYTRPAGANEYVNSMWEIQREPYRGDVINSYNDGPPAPGKPPLGPFYELETSSPALSLVPAQTYTHIHRTFHFVGKEADLDRIARSTLKIGIRDIATSFTAAARQPDDR